MYKQQIFELNNAKNAYIIAINVANRQKEHYYYETLPDLMNSMQDLSETRTAKLNYIWTRSAQLETAALERSREHLQVALEEIPKNTPILDSVMFIQHNKADWQEPPDFYFEASHVWRDTEDMATDEASKIFLLNLLGKGKTGLQQVKQEVDKKRREIEGLQRNKENIKIDETKAPQDLEVTRNLLKAWDELIGFESRRITMETEVDTILNAVGGKDLVIHTMRMHILITLQILSRVHNHTSSRLQVSKFLPPVISVEKKLWDLVQRVSTARIVAIPATLSAK